MTASFECSREDSKLISAIVERTSRLQKGIDRLTVEMDLTACHANGNPLRLADLLKADDFNFKHDVFGIVCHIDRDTGHLTDCFSPRFSA